MRTELISPAKELQQEILLRLEYLASEKMYSMKNRTVTYEDIVELEIINMISTHMSATFELTTEEVPYEILSAWSMVKIHKELIKMYNKQSRLKDGLYLDLLDKIANKLFISLFVSH